MKLAITTPSDRKAAGRASAVGATRRLAPLAEVTLFSPTLKALFTWETVPVTLTERVWVALTFRPAAARADLTLAIEAVVGPNCAPNWAGVSHLW